MKKLFVSVLIFALVISGTSFSASAHHSNLLSLDGDSTTSSADALMILQYSVGLIDFTEEQLTVADYNKDNKINSADALCALLNATGSDTEIEDSDSSDKTLYYYEDGTTGYEPKPGARYKANGVWQVVSWGNDLTDEEIKEDHKNDSTDPWY